MNGQHGHAPATFDGGSLAHIAATVGCFASPGCSSLYGSFILAVFEDRESMLYSRCVRYDSRFSDVDPRIETVAEFWA